MLAYSTLTNGTNDGAPEKSGGWFQDRGNATLLDAGQCRRYGGGSRGDEEQAACDDAGFRPHHRACAHHAVYDLSAHPEYVEPLCEDIKRVSKEFHDDDFVYHGLHRLEKMGSFLVGSQRFHSPVPSK